MCLTLAINFWRKSSRLWKILNIILTTRNFSAISFLSAVISFALFFSRNFTSWFFWYCLCWYSYLYHRKSGTTKRVKAYEFRELKFRRRITVGTQRLSSPSALYHEDYKTWVNHCFFAFQRTCRIACCIRQRRINCNFKAIFICK